ncbi:MAG: universal stress protein [Candidatus Binatus sp.]|uniref:universal stress protein n=1 Tax=Candidatus Binatus sp. TaxID=2811406 RepID=UPI003BB0E739
MDPYPFLEKDREGQLIRLARQRIPASVRYETLVLTGDPAERVLETARALDADLIVIGTHGRKALSHLILGSVAEKVVRESQIPVLTAHTKTGERKTV